MQGSPQTNFESVESTLATAIHNRSLYKTSLKMLRDSSAAYSEADEVLLKHAVRTCETISAETADFQVKLISQLEDAGIISAPGRVLSPNSGLQYHEMALTISPSDLEATLNILKANGFAVDDILLKMTNALSAYSSSVYLMAWDGVSTRLHLRWGKQTSALRRKLQPGPSDFAFVQLPRALWPLYAGIKPLRILTEKITGQRTADRLGLRSGSFSLGTPHGLLEALLAQMDLSQSDTLMDLGCGDGRILIAAAKTFGCKAIGYERNQVLADTARKAAIDAGVDDLVTIKAGDAMSAPLDQATMLFLFLPEALLSRLMHRVRSQVKAGTRVVAHEQHELHVQWRPNRRLPIFAQNAITVAHIWSV